MDTVTLIKKDALIPLTIGAGFVAKLQQALIYMLDERTDEEIDTFTAALRDKKELSGWMLHYETIALLIREIEGSARANNLTEDQELPNT